MNRILDHQKIHHIIKRIAYQILESNVEEEVIIIAGIPGGGLIFANRLVQLLQQITPQTIIVCEVQMNKNNPLSSDITTSLPPHAYQNKSVVLVDDVLNSGTTLIYGVAHFIKTPLKKLKTAVLVNRNHKKFPVKADFKGISLSTSLHEHVMVQLSESEDAIFLT